MAYDYKFKGTIERPTHLFRYPKFGGAASQYLSAEGDWVDDRGLMSYALDDPLGADDITLAEARLVATVMGCPEAIPNW